MKFKDFKNEIIKAGKDKSNKLSKRDEFVVEIARQVFEARTNAGFTQSKLAELIGSKQPVIARLEAGNTKFLPSNDLLFKIAEAVDSNLRPPRIMSVCSETVLQVSIESNQFSNNPKVAIEGNYNWQDVKNVLTNSYSIL